MALRSLWEQNQGTVLGLTIEQMVTMAGDGNLLDDSQASKELRHVLSELPSLRLFEHIETCLAKGFVKSGVVLQDLINELGRRLEYEVENGLYQGKQTKVGFDGIWTGHDDHSIVVEVKTTDAYRMNLDTIARYRAGLIQNQRISANSSILIIVGRNDTGDIEAQVRGSKHAWDMRLISADALRKLVELKEASDEVETVRKIQSLLIPFEYTRLDNIIDVMFATAKDVEAASEEGKSSEPEEGSQQQEHTSPDILRALRERVVAAMSAKVHASLIAKSRATYWTADKSIRVCCTLSKLHQRGTYWYAYHRHWRNFLKEGNSGFLVFGCVGRQEAYAVPIPEMEKIVDTLYVTERAEGRVYYSHVWLEPQSDGKMWLLLPKGQHLDLTSYAIYPV